ncbi:MAG: carbohydrate kinase family protein [Thermoanaerobaculia bacterium]
MSDTETVRDQLVVAGSLAFDHIMDFPGQFKDHILPDKLHVINISFLVERLTKERGGCAGNIAYTMALLGERPRIVGAVGHDFAEYGAWLEERGVDTSAIATFPEELSASGFAFTDRGDSQIWGFYVGAMKRARELSMAELAGERAVACIVAPDDPEAMSRHCEEARRAGLPFFFDPSFQVTAMEGEPLAAAARGARAIFVNDYEHSVFQEKTGFAGERLFELVDTVIVTLGEEGSRIQTAEGVVPVPAARVEEVVDPTGAGDAYRGGYLVGWRRGLEPALCGRLGSLAAAYAVERYGTQNHRYTLDEFRARYRQAFGTDAPL